MRKLAVLLVAGAVFSLAATSASAATSDAQATANSAAAAITSAVMANTAASLLASGGLSFSFEGSIGGGFRDVVRARDPRSGRYFTLENDLRVIPGPCGPGTVNPRYCAHLILISVFSHLSRKGLRLLRFAARHHVGLFVFVIAHIRPKGTNISSEAIQITTLGG